MFELLSSKNDGAIVRSLEDKATKFVSSRVHNFSHLESIEVFTVRDNVNLTEIFHAMEKDGGSVPDGKDAAALKAYFQKVFPDLDFERVYSSDLKKMVKWFEVLKQNDVEIKLTERPEEEPGEENAPDTVEAAEEAKPKPAAKEKKAPAKAAAAEADEAPKKAAPKKKATVKDEAPAEKKEKAPAKKAAPKKAAPKKKS